MCKYNLSVKCRRRRLIQVREMEFFELLAKFRCQVCVSLCGSRCVGIWVVLALTRIAPPWPTDPLFEVLSLCALHTLQLLTSFGFCTGAKNVSPCLEGPDCCPPQPPRQRPTKSVPHVDRAKYAPLLLAPFRALLHSSLWNYPFWISLEPPMRLPFSAPNCIALFAPLWPPLSPTDRPILTLFLF